MRCDVPFSGNGPKGMAFIEFEEERDAEDALNHWHQRAFSGTPLTVQVRKAPPAAASPAPG